MRKKIWMAFGLCCAVFLLLGIVQGIRQPEVLKEGLQIIGGYELEFEESETAPEDSESDVQEDSASDIQEDSAGNVQEDSDGNDAVVEE